MIAHIRDGSQTLTRWDGNGNETTEYYEHAIVVDNVVSGPDRTYVHIRDRLICHLTAGTMSVNPEATDP